MGLVEKGPAGGESFFCELRFLRRHIDLEDTIPSQGVDNGFSQCTVTCTSSDAIWEAKRLKVADLSLETRRH
jgi:hypothetical protein